MRIKIIGVIAVKFLSLFAVQTFYSSAHTKWKRSFGSGIDRVCYIDLQKAKSLWRIKANEEWERLFSGAMVQDDVTSQLSKTVVGIFYFSGVRTKGVIFRGQYQNSKTEECVVYITLCCSCFAMYISETSRGMNTRTDESNLRHYRT